MFALYKKELSYYLNNPVGYIVTILFAGFVNFMFMKDVFLGTSVSMRPFFGLLPWLLIIFVPALTMRSLSEEKRSNTVEVLLTLPLSETQIVLAKFFAILTVVLFGLLLTASIPVAFSVVSKVYLPEILVGYGGIFLFSASFAAISLLCSSLTKNQVIAFLVSLVTLFFLTLMATDVISSFVPRFIQEILAYLGPLYHLDNFMKGLIDFRSVFYFISVITVFLGLTIIDLEKRG
ncbi:ABC transporter permease [Candidatus Roizmanbacteria bacterium]|nr:ABC transporter permease [Candidatus Roizmanbacteria bacterium]